MTVLANPEHNKYPSILKWILGLGMLLALWWFLPSVLPESMLNGTLLENEKLPWYLSRVSGVVAYLLMSASTLWGLLLSTQLIKKSIPASVSFALHNSLSWAAIGLSLFHAVILLFDNYYTYTIADLLIPFQGPYKPLWVGVGTIGFYLILITSLSFYIRQWIGQKTWRWLHYLTFLAYIMTTIHAWMAGSDSGSLSTIYFVSAVVVLFLTFYRVLSAITGKK